MPPKDPAPTEDLLQIQIAIELDRGRKVAEIALEFQVPEKKVLNIARNAGLLESKKAPLPENVFLKKKRKSSWAVLKQVKILRNWRQGWESKPQPYSVGARLKGSRSPAD